VREGKINCFRGGRKEGNKSRFVMHILEKKATRNVISLTIEEFQ